MSKKWWPFRRKRTAQALGQPQEDPTWRYVRYDGFEVEVVGESHYQENLAKICNGMQGAGSRHYRAYVLKEDANPYDDQAVRIEIQKRTVGYLRRTDARRYRRWLARVHPGIERLACDAQVGRGSRGYFGVRLALPAQFK